MTGKKHTSQLYTLGLCCILSFPQFFRSHSQQECAVGFVVTHTNPRFSTKLHSPVEHGTWFPPLPHRQRRTRTPDSLLVDPMRSKFTLKRIAHRRTLCVRRRVSDSKTYRVASLRFLIKKAKTSFLDKPCWNQWYQKLESSSPLKQQVSFQVKLNAPSRG